MSSLTLQVNAPFDPAFDLFLKQQDYPMLFLRWSKIVGLMIDQRGNCTGLDFWIKSLGELLEKKAVLPAGKPGDEVIASMFSALILRQPRHPDFNRWFRLAKGVLEHTPDMNIKLQIIIHFSHYYRIQGSKSETQFRFIVSNRDDSNREIILTVLAFDVPV